MKELQSVLDDRDEIAQLAILQEERSKKIQELLSFSASDTVSKIKRHEAEEISPFGKSSLHQEKTKGRVLIGFSNGESESLLSVPDLPKTRRIVNDISASSLLSDGSNRGKRNVVDGKNTIGQARRLSCSNTSCNRPKSSSPDFRTSKGNSMSETRQAKSSSISEDVDISSNTNQFPRRNSMPGYIPPARSSSSSLEMRLDCLASITQRTTRTNFNSGATLSRPSSSSVDMRLDDLVKKNKRRTVRNSINSMSGTAPIIQDYRRSRSRSLDMELLDPSGRKKEKARRNSMSGAEPIQPPSFSHDIDYAHDANRTNRKPSMKRIGSASSFASTTTKTNSMNTSGQDSSRRTTSSSVVSIKSRSNATNSVSSKFNRAARKARHMAVMGGDLLTGVGTDAELLREQRKLRGECENCGQKCYEVKMFKRTAVTIPQKVFEGRCISCNPM